MLRPYCWGFNKLQFGYPDTPLVRYKGLYNYCQSVENELLNTLYQWLPSNVARFGGIQNIPSTIDDGRRVGSYVLGEEIGKKEAHATPIRLVPAYSPNV